MKSRISKQRIFRFVGFSPKISIFQKILWASILKVDGCSFGFWSFISKKRSLLKKNNENTLRQPYNQGGRSILFQPFSQNPQKTLVLLFKITSDKHIHRQPPPVVQPLHHACHLILPLQNYSPGYHTLHLGYLVSPNTLAPTTG